MPYSWKSHVYVISLKVCTRIICLTGCLVFILTFIVNHLENGGGHLFTDIIISIFINISGVVHVKIALLYRASGLKKSSLAPVFKTIFHII